MGMRVTTGMAMNLYRYNLRNSTNRYNDSQNKVLTHRKFTSFGESPAAATEAWRVRRAIVNTDIYQANNNDTYTRFNIAWATLGQISTELTDRDGRKADIYAASDPTASGRNTLGEVLRQTADSVIHTINGAKSGENFLFAGDDELYAPFAWGKNQWGKETLLYRGVDVNAGQIRKPWEDPVPKYWGNFDPETNMPCNMPDPITNPVDQVWVKYYKDLKLKRDYDAEWEKYQAAEEAYNKALKEYEDAINADPTNPDHLLPPEPLKPFELQDPGTPESPAEALKENPFKDDDVDDYGVPISAYAAARDIGEDLNKRAWAVYLVDQGNLTKLKAMSEEKVTIDLGMGMLEDDNGNLIDGTYYNRALPGINMLGFGVDEDGDPLNVCMIMRRLGEIYENCHPESGSYDKDDRSGTSMKAQELRKEAMRLLDKLKAGQARVDGQHVEVSAKSSFLLQNEDRLNLQGSYLTEKLVGIEDIDPADAITQLMWDYSCYSAALKVGTQLLTQSLIDYMS